MSDIEINRLLRSGLPLYTVLAGALLVLTIASILYLGREVFVPIALAALLSFVLAPVVRLLQRWGFPSWSALALTVLLTLGAFGLLVTIVTSQVASLAGDIPKYQTTISSKIQGLAGSGGVGGSFGRTIEALTTIGAQLENLGTPSPQPDDDAKGINAKNPMPVTVVQDGHDLVGTLGLVVSPLLHPLATTAIVVIFIIFILGAREDLRNRFVRLVGTEDIQRTTAAIDDAARRLSRLFLMQLAVNTAFGVVISVGLWLIGVPSPLLWGIIAGIFRFVPYVGAIIGAAFPILLSIAVDPGWTMTLYTGLLFLIVEPLVGHGLEPLLFGHSTGLAPVSVILAATIWTFLWGPIGLVLATPLTVCLVVLGRHVSRLNFIDVMLGDRPPLSPPELFYQRMLAGDPTEAIIQARDFLRGRALSTYYDEVALEALRLAHEDVARGRLVPERQAVLLRSTRQLVHSLGKSVRDPRPKGGQLGTEAAAAVLAAGPDQDVAALILQRHDLAPSWQAIAQPVVCIARADTLDEVIALMLSQVLTKHGVGSTVLHVDGQDAGGACSAAADAKIVCLSFVEPLSTLHLRYYVRLTRRAFAGGKVMLGIWRERDATMSKSLRRVARSDFVVPTIGAALSTVLAAAVEDQPTATRVQPGRVSAQAET